MFKLLRCKQYIKNVLVLAPLFCSGEFFNHTKLQRGILGFLVFCFLSSFVYIMNDLCDRDRDRKHPEKKSRPIAAGTVSVRSALILAGVLLLSAFLLNRVIFLPLSTVLLLIYLVINAGYSLGLKNYPVLDITLLAAGFLLRLQFGALVTGIAVSGWLFFTVMAISFYFALAKRRSELRHTGTVSRDVLKYYSAAFLDRHMSLCMGLTVVFYALWSMDGKTIEKHGSPYLIYTVPLLLLIMMRFNMDVENTAAEDPADIILHDPMLLAGGILFLVVLSACFYSAQFI